MFINIHTGVSLSSELLENFNARELKTVIVCNPGNVDKLHKALERNDYYSEPVIDLNISDEHSKCIFFSLLFSMHI